jgi:hypothetical protein
MNKYFAVFAACSFIGLPLARAQAPAPLDTAISTDGKLAVLNTGRKVVTAFVVTYDLPLPSGAKASANGQGWQIYDAATEPATAKPILAGQQVKVACHFSCGSTAYQLRAVISLDGTAWGDSAWAQRISNRRTYMAQALQRSIGDLTAAASQGTTREGLVTQFQESLSQETSGATDADLKGCIMSTRGVVLTNLQRVLQRSDGSEIPVNEVIQHEINSLQDRYVSVSVFSGQQ